MIFFYNILYTSDSESMITFVFLCCKWKTVFKINLFATVVFYMNMTTVILPVYLDAKNPFSSFSWRRHSMALSSKFPNKAYTSVECMKFKRFPSTIQLLFIFFLFTNQAFLRQYQIQGTISCLIIIIIMVIALRISSIYSCCSCSSSINGIFFNRYFKSWHLILMMSMLSLDIFCCSSMLWSICSISSFSWTTRFCLEMEKATKNS